MKRIIWLSIFLLSVFLSYGQISMRSSNSGLSVQAEYGFSQWQSEDFGVEPEGGQTMGFRVGYGINENVEIIAGASSTKINPDNFDYLPFRIFHGDLGARYTFGSTIKPFRFNVAGYLTMISSTQEVFYDLFDITSFKLKGFGGTISAGAKYHVNLPLAITLDAAITMGKFNNNFQDEFALEDKFDYQSSRISLGLVLYFNQF